MSQCCVHKDKTVAAFCQDCNEAICINCVIEHNKDKKEHKILSLMEITAKVVQKIDCEIEYKKLHNIQEKDTSRTMIKYQEAVNSARKVLREIKEMAIKTIDNFIEKQMKKIRAQRDNYIAIQKNLINTEKAMKKLKTEAEMTLLSFEERNYSHIIDKYKQITQKKEDQVKIDDLKEVKSNISVAQLRIGLSFGDYEKDLKNMLVKYEIVVDTCSTCKQGDSDITCEKCNLNQCKKCASSCSSCQKYTCVKCVKLISGDSEIKSCGMCESAGCCQCLSLCDKCRFRLCKKCLNGKDCLRCKSVPKVVPFVWSNGSTQISHSGDRWCNFYSNDYCPQYFSATIKIKQYSGSDMSGICFGISKNKHNDSPFLGTSVNEWAFNGGPNCWCSNTSITYGKRVSQNSVIKMTYNKDKSLSFEIDGQNQGVAYTDIEGPFCLGVSLFYTSTIELTEMISL